MWFKKFNVQHSRLKFYYKNDFVHHFNGAFQIIIKMIQDEIKESYVEQPRYSGDSSNQNLIKQWHETLEMLHNKLKQ